MTTKTIDYYASLNSPWGYLGSAALADVAKRCGATVNVMPMMLGAVLDRTGGLPLPKRSPERQAYRLVELARWRTRRGVQLNLQPAHFPADESLAARSVIAVNAQDGGQGGDALALATAVGKALWEEEKNIGEQAVIDDLVRAVGLDADAIRAAATQDATQAQWEANTEAAIAAGVFGAPAYVVDGELFWGQDRLEFVEEALSR